MLIVWHNLPPLVLSKVICTPHFKSFRNLLMPLLLLTNQSFELRVFPDNLKFTLVKPISMKTLPKGQISNWSNILGKVVIWVGIELSQLASTSAGSILMPCSRFHWFSAKELQSKIGHRMWILRIQFLCREVTIASSILKSTAAVAIYYCQQQRKASCGNNDLSLLQCWAAALISFLHISSSAGAITIYFQRPQHTGRVSVNIALSS